MINIVTIGLDKNNSTDVSYHRLEDANTDYTKIYACVIMRLSSESIALYKQTYERMPDFIMSMKLIILSDNEDTEDKLLDQLENYPWPEMFGATTIRVAANYINEEIEIMALQEGIDMRQYELFRETNVTREILEERVAISALRLKLAFAIHNLDLIKLSAFSK